jgi:DDE superfamily endonuclease
VGIYQLLLLNRYGSHLTKEFAEYCDKNRIILFAIPPYISHFLQPLDIILFQPFKNNHCKAVKMATQTGCTDFNKVEFLYYLKSIRDATFKALSIRLV